MLCSTTVCYNFKKEFDFSSTLENADYYFKRSFSKEKNKELLGESPFSEKIFPYGFNYFVSHRRIPVPFKDKIYDILKCAYQMCRFHSADKIVWEAEDFACPPTRSSVAPKIIFCTRLWDEPGFSKQELEHINSTRIELVRKLKQKYKENFMGGVYKNDLAVKMCPDLILPKSISLKRNYIKLMKESDICIGSIGLHQSIGWKTGEYVAASKAVVNEKFAYEVTGRFAQGVNYLEYGTVDECMQAVDRLYNDPEALNDMKNANYRYYNEYGSPKKLIENALKTAGVNLDSCEKSEFTEKVIR